MADVTTTPKATDLLSVKSRVSWGAIAAGAMIALAIYLVLTLLGTALSLEVAVRGRNVDLQMGAGIYSIVTLLVAMFFGGWATSRLAVGESKLEAVLYGIILWGVLFTGLIWMVSAGVSRGFGAIAGVAYGAYSSPEGDVDVDRIAADLKRSGVDEAQVNKVRDAYRRVQSDPGAAPAAASSVANDPKIRQAAGDLGDQARRATWWTLGGVVLSMITVILGSLTGSGELLQPVPILGVRRPARDPRV